jgi:CRP-like cAMP-binding protein
LLGLLDDPTRTAAVSMGRARSFSAGDLLLVQGERTTQLYLLLAGIVKVTAATPSGRTILLSVRTAGDSVGELAATDGAPRTATVTACGEVRTREVSAAQWRQFLAEQPAAQAAVNLVINERFRMATRRRIELGEHGAPVRIARLLVEFVELHGRAVGRGYELTMPLTQAEIAAAAECSIASAQAALRDFRKAGIIETRYRGFVVLDLPALRRRAMLT